MPNYKLTLEYDGSNFNGWQVQSRGERTIQGEIEKALKTIFSASIRVIGSGRTDSGVHALGQVAHFTSKKEKTTDEICRALNANLPNDIAIKHVEKVKDSFHAQYSAKSKTYVYTILTRPSRSAIFTKALHFPYTLNLRAMREEAKSFVGRHDFKSFAGTDPSKKEKDTVRTVKRVDIKKQGDFVTITVEGNGFLYKMVRNIVGALLSVGSGKLEKGSVKAILAKKDRRVAPMTAKAHGLCLLEVKY